MHRRAYSASCKARVMRAKANLSKEIRAAALIVSWRTAPGHASSCVGVPTRRRKSGLPLLERKREAANACTFGPERYAPASSIGDTACSHRCCRSADLADSRALRQAARYQAQRIFGPSQERRVLSNG